MKLDISLAPEILFKLGSFPVTNTLFWSFILSLVIIFGTLAIRFSLKSIPGRWQVLFELLIDEGMKFVEGIMKNKEKARKVFPFLVRRQFLFTRPMEK